MQRLFLGFLFLLFSSPALAGQMPSIDVRVSPASASSIPKGAQRIPMLTLTFVTPCGADGILRFITVDHRGQGALSDIARVYAIRQGQRLSRALPFSRHQGVVTLDLKRFALKHCTTETFDIMADFDPSSSAAAEHQLVIASASSIDVEDATVNISAAELTGARRVIAAGDSTTVVVDYLPMTETVSYGNARMVARLRLTADTTKDVSIRSVTLTNKGSASNLDLQHLYSRGVSTPLSESDATRETR